MYTSDQSAGSSTLCGASQQLLLRVLYRAEGDFVGTRIKGSAGGEDDAAGMPADCCVELRAVIPKVESCMIVGTGLICTVLYGYGNV